MTETTTKTVAGAGLAQSLFSINTPLIADAPVEVYKMS